MKKSLPPTAVDILRSSALAIEDRAASRDCPDGERSMLRCVETFNRLTGHNLSERDGWVFMTTLKLSRAQSALENCALNPDDYIDGAAYLALALECQQ